MMDPNRAGSAAVALSMAGRDESAAPVAQMETISAAAALAAMPGLERARSGAADAAVAAPEKEGAPAADVESQCGAEEAASPPEEESAASDGIDSARPGGASQPGKRHRATAIEMAQRKLEAALAKQKSLNETKSALNLEALKRPLTAGEKKRLKKAEEELKLVPKSLEAAKQAGEKARAAATAKAIADAKKLE